MDLLHSFLVCGSKSLVPMQVGIFGRDMVSNSGLGLNTKVISPTNTSSESLNII